MSHLVPPGYRRFDERGAIVVAMESVAEAVRGMLRAAPADRPTVHGFASHVPDARQYQGRETAYSVALPGTHRRVVVRHNRHGGALRAITGDLFVGMGGAPDELTICHELLRGGIHTPAILCYAVYPAGFGFSRSDVLTEEVPG